jgi:23S rRNA pseudouridine955/2504/2580 synthase
MLIPIIYQNDEIFIINKPAGLAVQGGEKITHSLDKDFAEQVGSKVYLVHRLDKETAGLMVVAKSPAAAKKWTGLISSKVVRKEYIAVCCGKLARKSGVIDESLVQHGETKRAVTKYTVEKEWTAICDNSGEALSLDFCCIRLLLETGRMHQIRIHLARQNCPICGDDQHGNFKLNKLLKKQFKIKNLLLAAVKLTVPIDGKETVFEIEQPEYFSTTCH